MQCFFAIFVVTTLQKIKNSNYEVFPNEVSQIAQLQSTESIDKAVVACAKTLLDGDDFDVSINKLLKTLCIYFDATESYIFELEKDKKMFHKNFIFENKYIIKDEDYFEVTKVKPSKIRYWLEHLQNDDKVYINENEETIEVNSTKYYTLLELNAFAIIIVPLRNNAGDVIGIVGINDPLQNTSDTTLIKTVSAFIVNDFEKRDILNELEILSYVDKLTGLKNRNCYLNTIDKIKENPPETLGIIFGDVNGLKRVNDNMGHKYGDTLISWSAYFLSQNIDAPIFRIGGDEFVAFIENKSEAEFVGIINNIRNKLLSMVNVHISVGDTFKAGDIDIDKQIVETDQVMYKEKQNYYISKRYNHMNLQAELEQLKETILTLQDELDALN